jgi:hypothetical protein
MKAHYRDFVFHPVSVDSREARPSPRKFVRLFQWAYQVFFWVIFTLTAVQIGRETVSPRDQHSASNLAVFLAQ